MSAKKFIFQRTSAQEVHHPKSVSKTPTENIQQETKSLPLKRQKYDKTSNMINKTY